MPHVRAWERVFEMKYLLKGPPMLGFESSGDKFIRYAVNASVCMEYILVCELTEHLI